MPFSAPVTTAAPRTTCTTCTAGCCLKFYFQYISSSRTCQVKIKQGDDDTSEPRTLAHSDYGAVDDKVSIVKDLWICV